jgi:O-antigen ligase
VTAATVTTVALVMSGSRSGFAAFAVATALLGVLLVRGQRSWSRAAFAAGAAGVVLAAATTFAAAGPLATRVASTSTEHWRFRLDSMRDALDLFARFPASGSGLNTYQHATLVYPTRDATAHWSAAHNDYVQVLAEGGWLVALPALLVVALIVRDAGRRTAAERRDQVISWRRRGAIVGLLAIALQSTVDFSLQIPANFWIACTLLGLAIGKPSERTDPQGLRP